MKYYQLDLQNSIEKYRIFEILKKADYMYGINRNDDIELA